MGGRGVHKWVSILRWDYPVHRTLRMEAGEFDTAIFSDKYKDMDNDLLIYHTAQNWLSPSNIILHLI